MQMIQIRRPTDSDWQQAELLSSERSDGVEVRLDDEQIWVPWANIHPADQVLLMVEQQARQRYAWVPPEDLE